MSSEKRTGDGGGGKESLPTLHGAASLPSPSPLEVDSYSPPADSAVELYALESMLYRAAWLCDTGQPFGRESAMVKLFGSEALDRIVDRAVQIHGGMGYSAEFKIEQLYRDARVTRIYEGTSEIQRIVIARDVLKKGS